MFPSLPASLARSPRAAGARRARGEAAGDMPSARSRGAEASEAATVQTCFGGRVVTQPRKGAPGVAHRPQLRVCERIPSRRRAAEASRRAALLLLAIAPGYASPISFEGRLARRAPRPPDSVRGFARGL